MVAGEGKAGLEVVPKSIFGNAPEATFAEVAGANPLCPTCKHTNTWRNGYGKAMFGKPIQRWICRDCGYRFSDSIDVARAKKEAQADQFVASKHLKSGFGLRSNCQICDENTSKFSVYSLKETKNLVTELQQSLTVPYKEKYDIKDFKGAVIEFLFYMQRAELAEVTYDAYCYSLEFLISNGANIFDPQSVKTTLSGQLKTKSDARKYTIVKAYKAFMKAYGIKATMPSYKPTRKLPYLPPEAHLDQLIACCSYEMAALLQTLKEIAARPVEALRIQWDEIDFIQRKIPINHPAKGCNPRVLDMSDKLYQMLMNLPRDRKKVFAYKNSASAGKTFRVMRKHAIQKLGIKELRKIHIYTFRYWRATVEFQEYKTEVAVMVLLGHKSTKYLWLYVQLAHIYFRDAPKKYISLWVDTREDESKAIESGFDYVRTDKDGASLYRKLDKTATTIGHD